jgi:hypothetical protein
MIWGELLQPKSAGAQRAWPAYLQSMSALAPNSGKARATKNAAPLGYINPRRIPARSRLIVAWRAYNGPFR